MKCTELLKVDRLNFNYHDVPILHDVSFELAAGEVLQVQGPNGVGKSTLLALLAGLLHPRSGLISWGNEAGENPEWPRNRFFSYLAAESNGLYLQMNAYNNVRFWSRLASPLPPDKNERDHLEAALSWWGLSHFYLQRGLAVGFLSTGMRRRLALARLSVSQTSCWLLDEPIYGLDRKGVALFRQGLEAHCAAGGRAIVVSHEQASLQGLALRSLELKEQR